MIRRFRAQPLRRQLWIANLLVCLPLVGLVLWSARATLRERQQELETYTQVVASTTAAYINRDLQGFDDMAGRLAADPALRSAPAVAARRLEEALTIRPSVLAMALVDASGREIARAGQPLRIDGWYEAVRRRGSRVVVPRGEPVEADSYVVVGYPMRSRDDGPIAGALGLYVALGPLQEAFSSIGLPERSIIRITGEDGRVLAQNPEGARAGGRVTAGTSPVAGPPQVIVGADGIARQHAEAAADAGPLVIHVGIPRAVATEVALPVWWRTLGVLAIALTAWFAVAWYLAQRFGDSVSHLDAAAQRIAAGDFSPMEHRPMPSAELADLQAAFDRMLQQFNATRAALDAQMGEERRIRQELETLQGQVIRQERLAAVGQLVSGVAHEINNPLQAILGFAELLQMQADVPEAVKADLRLIQKESARACAIIRNLALFARQQPAEAEPVLLSDVVRAVAELRQRRLETEDIELRIDDRATLRVTAALAELQQVVLNFVVNAEQAILASGRLPGRITIRTRDQGGAVVLEVEDTGPGISFENEAKLFQPFFTTKPVGQGTGLGLSISYGIIDSLGGVIGYRRAPAGGALFYFELPAAAAEEEVA